MKKLTDIESAKKYFLKLRKLLQKIPDGYEIAICSDSDRLYMCKIDAPIKWTERRETGYDVPSVGFNSSITRLGDGTTEIIAGPINIERRLLSNDYEIIYDEVDDDF